MQTLTEKKAFHKILRTEEIVDNDQENHNSIANAVKTMRSAEFEKELNDNNIGCIELPMIDKDANSIFKKPQFKHANVFDKLPEVEDLEQVVSLPFDLSCSRHHGY